MAAESAINLFETRAASMAVSPPPMTTTLLPISTFLPELAWLRNSVPVQIPGPLLTGNPHVFALVGADRDVDGIVLLAHVVKGDVLTDLGVALELHTEIEECAESRRRAPHAAGGRPECRNEACRPVSGGFRRPSLCTRGGLTDRRLTDPRGRHPPLRPSGPWRSRPRWVPP